MLVKAIQNHIYKLIVFLAMSLSITAYSKVYYVNDNFILGDRFTSAVGVNAVGNGTLSTSPVLTLKYLFTQYSAAFVSGDSIKIDTGTYGKGGSPSNTTESNFNITTAGLVIIGTGMVATTFSNNFHGTGSNYFMYVTANNTTIKDLTITKYYGAPANSGVTYNGINTGAQAITVANATGVVIENVSLFDNGTNGNAAVTIGPSSTVLIKGGGSNCNATGSSYSGGIDAIGNNINLTIQNVIIAYNSKTLFNGAGLYVYSIHTTNNVNVFNSSFMNNTGGLGGGAGVYCHGGNINLRTSSIESNTVSTSGGPYRVGAGIAIVGGTMTITKCKIFNNKSLGSSTTDFGGVGLTPSAGNIILKIDSCSFSGNNGARTTGNDIGARINNANTFSITVNETTFNTGAIDIGGGSTNSCAGNTFRITNSGNPTISYSGSGACVLGAGSNTSAPHTFTSPAIPTFTGTCSNFTILPIELTRFEGDCNNDEIVLNWQTASEKNNSLFYVEKSADGIQFHTIGTVKGAGTTHQKTNYTFIDENKTENINYYRLKQIDYNGKENYSSIISVDHDCLVQPKTEIMAYPNPTNGLLAIDFKLFKSSSFRFEIIDGLGRIISTSAESKYESGLQSFNLDLNSVREGIYILRVWLGEELHILKVLKQ